MYGTGRYRHGDLGLGREVRVTVTGVTQQAAALKSQVTVASTTSMVPVLRLRVRLSESLSLARPGARESLLE